MNMVPAKRATPEGGEEDVIVLQFLPDYLAIVTTREGKLLQVALDSLKVDTRAFQMMVPRRHA